MNLKPELYRKAARRLEDEINYGACCAIDAIEQYTFGPHCRAFDKVFRPEGQKHSGFWVNNLTTSNESQSVRVLMLYLMAELVETNSLP